MTDETRRMVQESGDRIPVSPAPLERLLARGRRARRRRSIIAAGAVVVVLGVISGGAVAVGAQLTSDSSKRTAVSTPRPDVAAFTPPPGMRYVGRNGIAVAIPSSWRPTGRDSVQWRAPLTPGQSSRFAPVVHPSVSIEPYQLANFFESHARPVGSVAGAHVSRYGPYAGCAFRDCVLFPIYFEGTVMSRQADVLIRVVAAPRGEVAAILDSVTAIPPGYVVIPEDAGPRQLHRLGLRVRMVPLFGPVSGPVSSRPGPGTVVPRGSVVTVHRF